MIWLLLLMMIGLAGCTTSRLEAFVDAMNARNVSGCYHVEGHLSAYLSLKGSMVTGEMPIERCIQGGF